MPALRLSDLLTDGVRLCKNGLYSVSTAWPPVEDCIITCAISTAASGRSLPPIVKKFFSTLTAEIK